HGVDPLRIVALIERRAVGIDVAALHALDQSDMAAHVARQPRVRRRMDVLRAHAVADLEARRSLRRPRERAARHDALDALQRELAALERLAGPQRAAGGELVG